MCDATCPYDSRKKRCKHGLAVCYCDGGGYGVCKCCDGTAQVKLKSSGSQSQHVG